MRRLLRNVIGSAGAQPALCIAVTNSSSLPTRATLRMSPGIPFLVCVRRGTWRDSNSRQTEFSAEVAVAGNCVPSPARKTVMRIVCMASDNPPLQWAGDVGFSRAYSGCTGSGPVRIDVLAVAHDIHRLRTQSRNLASEQERCQQANRT